MGLVLDSSVVVAAERRGDNVTQLLKKVVSATDDQRCVLSAIGPTELAHGINRAQTPAVRSRHESFIRELLDDVDLILTLEVQRCWRAGLEEDNEGAE